MRNNPVINAFFERLVERGKAPKSAVIACTAKLLRIAYGVLTRDAPFTAIPK